MKNQVELVALFSGHYLTEQLPAGWDAMEDYDLMEYIEDHLAEDFETWHPNTVMEHIALEEDCDAGRFIQAWEAKFGELMAWREWMTDGEHEVRYWSRIK